MNDQSKENLAEVSEQTIPLSHLRKIVSKMHDLPPETPISFEYLLTATFPRIWDNVLIAFEREHMAGFQEGRAFENGTLEDQGIEG